MIDGSSIGLPERSKPGVTHPRHIPGQRQVSWDLLRSGFVLLVVAYHATYVAPVIHPELAPRPFSFSHQVGASLLLVVSAYFAAATVVLGNWRPQEFPFLDGSYWTLPFRKHSASGLTWADALLSAC